MSRFKVLLVDDEQKITDGLAILIDWAGFDCEIAGKAYNGAMGVELALSLRPDLIVTDIRMPFKDGLEMIRELQERHRLPCRYIVLSGYSDFAYARQAMQLGVKHYVVKPVEETELEESLRRSVAELRTERQQREELEALRQSAGKYRRRLAESLVRDLALGGESEHEMATELKELQCKLPAPPFVCIVAEKTEKEAWSEADLRHIARLLEETGEAFVGFRHPSETLGLLLPLPAGSPDKARTRLAWMHRLLAAAAGGPVRSVMSAVCDHTARLRGAFREAVSGLAYAALHGLDPAVLISDLPRSASYEQLSDAWLSELEAAVDQANEGQAQTVVKRMFAGIEAADFMPPDVVQLWVLNVVSVLLGTLPRQQLPELAEYIGVRRMLPQTIAQGTPEQMRQKLSALASGILRLKTQQQHAQRKDVLSEVKLYIEKAYAEPLSLSLVAERFYINPHYLSQLFKKRTGETFLHYVTKVRMAQAQRLFEETRLKIYEVGRQVGYEDTKYFSKIFERFVGMKPSDYKAAQTRQEN